MQPAGGAGTADEAPADVRFPRLDNRQRVWGVDVELDIRPGDQAPQDSGWWGEQEDPTSGVVWPVRLLS